MSITSAMTNALSGLAANARAAEIVSSNVANALTEGYARRELVLSAQNLGGRGAGVRVDGIARAVNQSVLNDKRLADAAASHAGLRGEFELRVEQSIGDPGESGSLGGRIAAFEAAIAHAASRPDSEARLQSVMSAAADLAGKLRGIQSEIQAARSAADARIGREVDELNAALGEVDGLNTQIVAERAAGRDASALFDQRQAIVDRIARIVPLREAARDRDQIALFTTGGAVLLDGRPAAIGFSPAGQITPDMTLGSGALSGLTVNGQPVLSTETGPLGGGSLGAALAVRDDLGPDWQAQIDAVARDLVERFESPAVDPTRAPGQAGLLTDAGLALDPMHEAGLAGRISVNAGVDPSRGGALWRLRDGLGAAGPGSPGDATLLLACADALSEGRIPASGRFVGAARSASGLAADVLSQAASERLRGEERSAYLASRQQSLASLHLENGVDTDAEMQRLLLIEEAFAANARVIQTLDDLLQQIMRL